MFQNEGVKAITREQTENRQNTIKINKRVNVPNWHYTVYSNSLYGFKTEINDDFQYLKEKW